MGLADVVTIPQSDTDLLKYANLHYLEHVNINRRLLEVYNQQVPLYDISFINPDNNGIWQYQHQQMHNNQNAILGISGNDLLGVDWKNLDILRAWLFLHFPEHKQANEMLGL